MRLSSFAPVSLAVFSLLTVACDDAPAAEGRGKKSGRFAAVKETQGQTAARTFCEVTHARGEQAPRFVAPATRPLPTPSPADAAPADGWRWVNLWATWCRPCIEEMGMLAQWQKSLAKDGVPLKLELFSVDDDGDALQTFLQKNRIQGEVQWLKGGGADLPAVLKTLGVDENAPIPVHALIDSAGAVRCVRTGSVSDGDYAAVKTMLLAG